MNTSLLQQSPWFIFLALILLLAASLYIGHRRKKNKDSRDLPTDPFANIFLDPEDRI